MSLAFRSEALVMLSTPSKGTACWSSSLTEPTPSWSGTNTPSVSVINPSIENALILRHIPRKRPIAIRTLTEYVESDFREGIDRGVIDPLKTFAKATVEDHIRGLIKDQTLVPGLDYRWGRESRPAYVSLSDSTAVCLTLQPGIKSLQDKLPIGGAGLLDLLAEGC